MSWAAGELFELRRLIDDVLITHFGRPNRPEQRNINDKLDWIIENMSTKADLDAALTQLKQDITEATSRATAALADLQAKVDAGQDFSAELQTLQQAHSDLASIGAGAGASSATGTTTGATPAPSSSGDSSPHPLNTDTGVREPAAPAENQDTGAGGQPAPAPAPAAPEGPTPNVGGSTAGSEVTGT